MRMRTSLVVTGRAAVLAIALAVLAACGSQEPPTALEEPSVARIVAEVDHVDGYLTEDVTVGAKVLAADGTPVLDELVFFEVEEGHGYLEGSL